MPHGIRSLAVAATTLALAGAGIADAGPSAASSPSIAVACSSQSFDLGRGGSVVHYAADCTASDGSPIDGYTVVSAPRHAAAFSFDPATGVVDYTAADGFLGVDTVTFTATSGTATSGPATLTFDIANSAPSCLTLAAQHVIHDRTLTVRPTCSDPEGDSLVLQPGTVAAAHGGLTVSGSSLVYRPAAGFVGTDHFSYRAFDGALVSPQVTVSVQVTDAAPTCSSSSVATTHDRTRIIAIKCSDADHDPLTAVLLATPQHGSARVVGKDAIAYKPARHFLGSDVLTYLVSDGVDVSRVAAVRLSVVNHLPRLAGVPSRVTVRHAVRFRASVSDRDGDAVALRLARSPKHGRVIITGHVVTYRAHRGYHGADSFRLRASDGVSDVTKLVHVTVR